MKNSKKLSLAVLFGGRSAEHEVSLLSAYNILSTLTKEVPLRQRENWSEYQILAIGITRSGKWILLDDWLRYLAPRIGLPSPLTEDLGLELFLLPGQSQPIRILKNREALEVDLVFPVLHGPYGEDGSLQGLLKQLGLPFVGGGVLSSGVGMDKAVMKTLLDGKVSLPKFIIYHCQDRVNKKFAISFSKVKDQLGLPFYVKPASQGSSVGIHRVSKKREFEVALYDAFSYDHKVLLEENIDGREMECAIIGRGNEAKASRIGEIVPPEKEGFYSYQAKYVDAQAATLHMPAKLRPNQERLLQEVAIKTFQILGLEDMARVDMFLQPKGRIVVNEVNTIPGFTEISMYPGLWDKSGVPLGKLLNHLITLAFERFQADCKLKIQPD